MFPTRIRFKMVEWLAIVYDNPGVSRAATRAQHLAGIPASVASGKVVSAGAIFNEVPKEGVAPNFAGSALSIIADSKEEVLEILSQDVYAKEGIWDLNNVLIYPTGVAYRKAKDF